MEPSNWPSGFFSLGCCFAVGVSSEIQKHRPSETSPVGELINGAIDSSLNDCYWSFVCGVDTLNIVSVNPVICACCKLFLSRIALKLLLVLMFFE